MKHSGISVVLLVLLLSVLWILVGCRDNAEQSDGSTESENTTQSEASKETQTETETETLPEEVETVVLAFEPMDDIVYPYIDVVREYLEAGAAADVNDYEFHVDVQAKPITVKWHLDGATAQKYQLEISTESDYSHAEIVELAGGKTSYDLKYLLRDTRYYLRLTVLGQDIPSAEFTFKTAYLGPRFLDVGGYCQNCRDLGGYKVGDKTLLYNMVIRGSSPDNCLSASTNTFTREGKIFLTQTVQIQTQLDLRGSSENCGRTTSSFSDANYVHVPLTAYTQCFAASQAELYAEAFRVFADPANYPVYVHCAGGADRTGTVAAILLAYLGVSEDEVVQDYVVTSFSPVCAEQSARVRENILAVLDGLDAYEGDTLSEKAGSYLMSLGLTQQELFNIKAIMFGESLDDFVPTVGHGIQAADRFYDTTLGVDYSFLLNDDLALSAVLLDDQSVMFRQDERSVTIPASAMSALSNGTHTVTAVFSDGERTTISFSVNLIDLTGILQVTSIEEDGELTYVYITASSAVFNGIEWHFHTRRGTLYPDVEPNIKINGETVADINDNTDMSDYTWTTYPASDDARHRVPVDIYASGNTMKLVLRTEWLSDYLDGQEFSVTLCNGMNYTVDDRSYTVLADITYRYTNGVWVKV